VPRIEVTFDIDVNGIVHVSAKDLGTGKEQKITITSSTGLKEEEIQRMVKDAEKYAEEDRKKKEKIEAKNHADSLIYQSEKMLGDLKDKISQEDVDKVKKEIENVRKALESDDVERIKKATDDLTKVFYDISSKLYQSAGQGNPGAGPNFNPGAGANPFGGGAANESKKDEKVVDADYKVMDDNDKK
jgi:molecular chaperone DnaK